MKQLLILAVALSAFLASLTVTRAGQPSCGDGNVDAGEACDDGNNDDGDGCSANCTRETRACCMSDGNDGFTCEDLAVRECDAAGGLHGSQISVCDGFICDCLPEEPEGCKTACCLESGDCQTAPPWYCRDYRGGVPNEHGITCEDPCISIACAAEMCDVAEPDDACDTRACLLSDGSCADVDKSTCQFSLGGTPGGRGSTCDDPYDCDEPYCGDGNVDDGEECDDGNNDDGDGCSANCTVDPYCGDGNVDDGEECDDGNNDDGDGCSANCTVEPSCGDGNVDDGEECDDGNNDDGDGCSANCTVEPYCGDGVRDDNEVCDGQDDDACPGECQPDCSCNECARDSDCDDGLYCNGQERCLDGTCVPGEPPPIEDDGVFCTLDRCVESCQCTIHKPKDSWCSNNQYCDGIEYCDEVNDCQPGDPPHCPGQFCNESTHTCVDCRGFADCDDGNYCNGLERCLDHVCQPAFSTPCGDECCDEATHQCRPCADYTACNDDDPCTNDAWNPEAGKCVYTTFCDDGDPCTVDQCDGGACSYTDVSCPDGLRCHPVSGSCAKFDCIVNAECDDGASCTTDFCDGTGFCAHIPDHKSCDDGLYCTEKDSCDPTAAGADASGCVHEGDPCGDATCDEDSDACATFSATVDAMGSRHLKVVVRSGGTVSTPIAIRVTSPDYPCLDKYAMASGMLTRTPVYRPSNEWRATLIRGKEIVPSTLYEVALEVPAADFETVRQYPVGVVRTQEWADVVARFGIVEFDDVAAMVDCYVQSEEAPALEQCDIYPATTDGLVDFRDISGVVDAFAGVAYPFGAPCSSTGGGDE